ncbi:hypothetical protein CRG98_047323 [Punica granatum]|uniref:Uncharacterized protein n=1 Tax=Punica granatum TaxID=22663 RepID=A0A2I0HKM3_PUNGR|nr:hypothetical protein CRG98_047323 [Punica granatum]
MIVVGKVFVPADTAPTLEVGDACGSDHAHRLPACAPDERTPPSYSLVIDLLPSTTLLVAFAERPCSLLLSSLFPAFPLPSPPPSGDFYFIGWSASSLRCSSSLSQSNLSIGFCRGPQQFPTYDMVLCYGELLP